ncbi:hypothetical protein EW146_g6209 [Bondarzewia mesenterica]|uniref:Zinc-finger domain-containing protein n=1 Tax=Bondarzewia mesenterica TaxID=1095465 RepID=A0A4S4LPC6_9AGAM|nr:hypothetical protein EW146_g6209 [Bondarzewia mesenterica]
MAEYSELANWDGSLSTRQQTPQSSPTPHHLTDAGFSISTPSIISQPALTSCPSPNLSSEHVHVGHKHQMVHAITIGLSHSANDASIGAYRASEMPSGDPTGTMDLSLPDLSGHVDFTEGSSLLFEEPDVLVLTEEAADTAGPSRPSAKPMRTSIPKAKEAADLSLSSPDVDGSLEIRSVIEDGPQQGTSRGSEDDIHDMLVNDTPISPRVYPLFWTSPLTQPPTPQSARNSPSCVGRRTSATRRNRQILDYVAVPPFPPGLSASDYVPMSEVKSAPRSTAPSLATTLQDTFRRNHATKVAPSKVRKRLRVVLSSDDDEQSSNVKKSKRRRGDDEGEHVRSVKSHHSRNSQQKWGEQGQSASTSTTRKPTKALNARPHSPREEELIIHNETSAPSLLAYRAATRHIRTLPSPPRLPTEISSPRFRPYTVEAPSSPSPAPHRSPSYESFSDFMSARRATTFTPTHMPGIALSPFTTPSASTHAHLIAQEYTDGELQASHQPVQPMPYFDPKTRFSAQVALDNMDLLVPSVSGVETMDAEVPMADQWGQDISYTGDGTIDPSLLSGMLAGPSGTSFDAEPSLPGSSARNDLARAQSPSGSSGPARMDRALPKTSKKVFYAKRKPVKTQRKMVTPTSVQADSERSVRFTAPTPLYEEEDSSEDTDTMSKMAIESDDDYFDSGAWEFQPLEGRGRGRRKKDVESREGKAVQRVRLTMSASAVLEAKQNMDANGGSRLQGAKQKLNKGKGNNQLVYPKVWTVPMLETMARGAQNFFCCGCIEKRYPDIVFDTEMRFSSCPHCANICNCTHCCQVRGETYISEKGGGWRELAKGRDGGSSISYVPAPKARHKSTKTSSESKRTNSSSFVNSSSMPIPKNPFPALPSGSYWGAVYGLTGEKVGTAYVDDDQECVVVRPSSAAPAAGRAVAKRKKTHVFIGRPRKVWGKVRVRELDEDGNLVKMSSRRKRKTMGTMYTGSIEPLRARWRWKPLSSVFRTLFSDSPLTSPTSSELTLPEEGEGELGVWPGEVVFEDAQDTEVGAGAVGADTEFVSASTGQADMANEVSEESAGMLGNVVGDAAPIANEGFKEQEVHIAIAMAFRAMGWQSAVPEESSHINK